MNPTVADRRLTPAALIIGLFTGLVIWNLPIPALRGESPEVIEVASFSSAAVGQTIPDGWTPLIFKNIPRQTKYALVKEGDITVVKAESNASASGLTRAVTIDPHEYPIIRWRWKVDHVLLHSDVSRKDGDDYPARLYVTFEYDEKRVSFSKKLKYAAGRAILGDIPIGALNYIWETRTPVGTVVENAYTDFAQMIVIESGPQHVGKWVDEERNVLNDYRMAFGEDPPLINGVAIMTDTDNTKEQVTAYYGDITFSKLPQ
ncbi:MAG: DUF3047 domain-containing protein [Nitrospira sp.]|nr:DUF3047 domain-containing protein [Nitrospira sp.]